MSEYLGKIVVVSYTTMTTIGQPYYLGPVVYILDQDPLLKPVHWLGIIALVGMLFFLVILTFQSVLAITGAMQ